MGEEIRRHVLEDGGQRVALLNLGCITQSWEMRDGTNIVLGYDRAGGYRQNPMFLGAIVGRVAGRIGGAAFTLDGTRWQVDASEPPNCLHGGAGGIHTRLWQMETDGARAVELRLTSEHGDQGFPGRLDLTVTIRLENGWLTYDMAAEADRPTPVSLAQHSYYNLAGHGTIWDHRLRVPADTRVVSDAANVATERTEPVAGTPLDLQAGRTIAEADPESSGLDMTYARLAATEESPVILTAPGGREMRMVSDQPCLQAYTGAYIGPLHGSAHAPFHGLCLEPQGWPNAVNRPAFPQSIAAPGAPYRQRLALRVTP